MKREERLNRERRRIRSRALDFATSRPRPRNYGESMVYWLGN